MGILDTLAGLYFLIGLIVMSAYTWILRSRGRWQYTSQTPGLLLVILLWPLFLIAFWVELKRPPARRRKSGS